MRSKAFPKRIARISQRFKLKSIVGNFLCYKKCNLKWIVWLNVIKLNIHLHSSSYQHINICTVVFKWHFCLMLIAFYVPQRQCNVKHHSIYIHFSNKKTVNVSNLFISNKRRMLSECREIRTKKKKPHFISKIVHGPAECNEPIVIWKSSSPSHQMHTMFACVWQHTICTE